MLKSCLLTNQAAFVDELCCWHFKTCTHWQMHFRWRVVLGLFKNSLPKPAFLGKNILQMTTVGKTWLRHMVYLKTKLVNFLMLLSIYIVFKFQHITYAFPVLLPLYFILWSCVSGYTHSLSFPLPLFISFTYTLLEMG